MCQAKDACESDGQFTIRAGEEEEEEAADEPSATQFSHRRVVKYKVI